MTGQIEEVLSPEQIEAIEKHVVAKGEKTHTTSQLWDMLADGYAEELELRKNLPLYDLQARGHDERSPLYRRREWACNALSAKLSFMETLAWHLGKRGDATIDAWLHKRVDYVRAHEIEWLSSAWRAHHV